MPKDKGKGITMLRDLILKNAPKRANVEVPDIGQVTVRGLTAGEAYHFQKVYATDPVAATFGAITAGVLDEKGGSMFSEADAAELANVSPQMIEVLAKAVLDLSAPAANTPEKK